MNWVVFASGEGAGVKQMGRGAGKAEWQLAIDVIPAFEEIELPFLTVRPRQDVLPIGLTDTNTMQLVNYLLGSYQFSTPDGWKTQQVVMAILFDPTNRTISSLPAENTTTNWRSVSRRMFTDF